MTVIFLLGEEGAGGGGGGGFFWCSPSKSRFKKCFFYILAISFLDQSWAKKMYPSLVVSCQEQCWENVKLTKIAGFENSVTLNKSQEAGIQVQLYSNL